MRGVLLWMARNAWLRDHLPRLPFARRAVLRFMPGESLDEAWAAADRLFQDGHGVLFTHLGENLERLSDAELVVAHYQRLLDRAATSRRAPEISVKLTQLGLDIDPEAAFAHAEELARRASEVSSFLWLDMEASAYVERTLAVYERLRQTYPRTGICLQAYLKRTAADFQRLLPLEPAVRLVKGAYDEPETVALRAKAEVDANFHTLALLMADAARDGKVRLTLGTHDSALLARIAAATRAKGISRDRIEVHMLYGIRESELRRFGRAGFPTASLISYGEAWYAWYMRRLAERPANVVFALRQLLP